MGGVNKILLPLGNSNVIGTALTAFQNTDSITDIVVVCRDQDREEIEKTAENIGITKLHAFAKGGDTRQKSVMQGVKLVSKDSDYIAVHDGARPLVKTEHISKVIKDARVFGGATLGVPVKDTIKTVDDGSNLNGFTFTGAKQRLDSDSVYNSQGATITFTVTGNKNDFHMKE